MWVKRDNKTIFLDLNEYFLNLGNIEKEVLKKIVADSKTNEFVKLYFPKSMIPDIQKAFTILDYKATGTVGFRDAKVTLRALGIEPTATKLRKLIERSSVDKTHELSREEYHMMFVHALNDVDSEEQMIKAFQSFDTQNMQSISFENLKKIAEQLQLDVADEEIKEMIKFADDEEDGRVTLGEFINAARKIF